MRQLQCRARVGSTFCEGDCGKEWGQVVASPDHAARQDACAICCGSDAGVHNAVAKHRHIPACSTAPMSGWLFSGALRAC